MKTIKLTLLALSLGLFAASCDNTETSTVEKTDTLVAPTGEQVEIKTETTEEAKINAAGDTTKVETTTETTAETIAPATPEAN